MKTQNALGEPLVTWVSEATVWAAIEPATGREALAAMQVGVEAPVAITIRFRPGVTPQSRLRTDTAIYEIQSVRDVDGRGRALELFCLARHP